MTNETTASQPKSIGDDAQFRKLMLNFMNYSTVTLPLREQPEYRAIAEFIDSRTPAAQASATIQAAPDERALFEEFCWVDDRLGTAQYGQRDGDYAEHDTQYAWLAWQARASLAATIQEPVMVAPHDINDDGHFATLLGTGMHPLTQKCIIDFVNSWGNNLAAPMVADPAGVAYRWPTFRDWLASPINPPSSQNEYTMMAFNAGREVAATVKAVPSEALDGLQRFGWTEAYAGDTSELVEDAIGTYVKFDDLKALFAASLADKTGGAQ